MVINLFSIFEPTRAFNLSINWIRTLLIFIVIPIRYWHVRSRSTIALNYTLKIILSELLNDFRKKSLKRLFIFLSLFIFIVLNNLLGLFPYVFTRTGHIIITLRLGLPLWARLTIYGWARLTNSIFCHLVPIGTPINLSVFIVLIESIRSFIRPITLSIRLAANIIAGHLLLSLLSEVPSSHLAYFLPTRALINILLILEFAVAVIQSYVFVILISLYINEIN